MKQIVSAILVFVTFASFGQKFEISVGGGAGISNTIDRPIGFGPNSQVNNGVSGLTTAGIKILRTRRKWQYGIEIADMQLSYKKNHYLEYYLPDSQVIQEVKLNPVTVTMRAIPTSLVLDRKLSLDKVSLYFGINAGMIWITHSHIPASGQFLNATTQDFISPTGHGYLLGAHIGADYFFTRRIGANLNIAGSYQHFYLDDMYSISVFQLTAGICYKI